MDHPGHDAGHSHRHKVDDVKITDACHIYQECESETSYGTGKKRRSEDPAIATGTQRQCGGYRLYQDNQQHNNKQDPWIVAERNEKTVVHDILERSVKE